MSDKKDPQKLSAATINYNIEHGLYDHLNEMFHMQRKLQETLGYNFDTMSTEERKAYLDEYFKHTHQELFEAQMEIPGFKAWKKYPEDIYEVGLAYYKAKEELIDVWHFFMNLCIALNMDAEEFYELYKEKNAENYARQTREEYKKCIT